MTLEQLFYTICGFAVVLLVVIWAGRRQAEQDRIDYESRFPLDHETRYPPNYETRDPE